MCPCVTCDVCVTRDSCQLGLLPAPCFGCVTCHRLQAAINCTKCDSATARGKVPGPVSPAANRANCAGYRACITAQATLLHLRMGKKAIKKVALRMCVLSLKCSLVLSRTAMVQLFHFVLNEKFCLCGWAVEVEGSNHPRTLSKEVCLTGFPAHNSSFPCC